MKVLKFSASWCGPCKMLSMTIAGIKDEIPYPIEEIDIDENSEMAQKFGIRGVPTLVLVDGDTEVKRKVGSLTAAELKAFIG
jgi:thiol-disulfide isomerase/thioredoxin